MVRSKMKLNAEFKLNLIVIIKEAIKGFSGACYRILIVFQLVTLRKIKKSILTFNEPMASTEDTHLPVSHNSN